jgi:hypothetical protein
MAVPEVVEFENEGITFICRSGPSPATPGTNWWWLTVTGESHRHAAFRVEPGDTAKNLTPRVLAYYKQLLEDRARPREIRATWSRSAPAKPAESPDAAKGAKGAK